MSEGAIFYTLNSMSQKIDKHDTRKRIEVGLSRSNPKKLEVILAKERTILAKQRNFLAHINTGLGSIALGFGILRFFENSQRSSLIWHGVVFIILGCIVALYGTIKVYRSNLGLQKIKQHRGHLYELYFPDVEEGNE